MRQNLLFSLVSGLSAFMPPTGTGRLLPQWPAAGRLPVPLARAMSAKGRAPTAGEISNNVDGHWHWHYHWVKTAIRGRCHELRQFVAGALFLIAVVGRGWSPPSPSNPRIPWPRSSLRLLLAPLLPPAASCYGSSTRTLRCTPALAFLVRFQASTRHSLQADLSFHRPCPHPSALRGTTGHIGDTPTFATATWLNQPFMVETCALKRWADPLDPPSPPNLSPCTRPLCSQLHGQWKLHLAVQFQRNAPTRGHPHILW